MSAGLAIRGVTITAPLADRSREAKEAMMLSGGCLCGAVRYEADGEPVFACFCHCRDCQKATGTGHAAALSVPRGALRVSGETRPFAKNGDSGLTTTRHFCPICGSVVMGEIEIMPDIISLYAGTLDDPSAFQPQLAIFARSRPAWDHVAADLPTFEAAPPPPATDAAPAKG